MFCFLIGSYLIHFNFFLSPLLFLPSRGHTVPPFHRSEWFHRSTTPPDRYLLLTGPTDFHVERSSTITSNQKHYASSRTMLVNVVINSLEQPLSNLY